MNGAGNQFLLHIGAIEPDKLIKQLEGEDGILILEEDDGKTVFMRIINADGAEAEQCGNGLRCAALHLVRSKSVDSNEVVIRTLAGLNKCVVHDDRNEVEVTLGAPKKETTQITAFPNLVFVNMGNPNAVFWTDDDPVDVRDSLGHKISSLPEFKDGMNVHFARRDGEQYATCASYERGVGNTHASGTGGASVFVASGSSGPFYVSSVGGTLTYYFDESGLLVMAGPACYS
jgi:diaminopimelate epimerase